MPRRDLSSASGKLVARLHPRTRSRSGITSRRRSEWGRRRRARRKLARMIPLLNTALIAAVAASLLMPQAAPRNPPTANATSRSSSVRSRRRNTGLTDSSPAIASRCRSPNGATAARATAAAIFRATAATCQAANGATAGATPILSRTLECRQLRPVLEQTPIGPMWNCGM